MKNNNKLKNNLADDMKMQVTGEEIVLNGGETLNIDNNHT